MSILGELLENGIKRGMEVTAIGGGITQDIATFAASILFRGIKWKYIPTTLLAQCDSCIGGKSSLNFKSWKNQLGNFYPPSKIYICTDFLKTLPEKEIRSGIGEMIKVHMISGNQTVNQMTQFMSDIYNNGDVMKSAIYNSLLLKKAVIEKDEFDTSLRLKMNLGHSFGHALEVASNYLIPHGIAVNIGLQMASYFSFKTNHINEEQYKLLISYTEKNLKIDDFKKINVDLFFNSLKKDKKNTEAEYGFILPIDVGNVQLNFFPITSETNSIILDYLQTCYGQLNV